MSTATARGVSVAVGLLVGVIMTAHAAPDAIFINAQVFTADEARPAAQAFAVEGGRILAIGEQDEVLAHKRPHTQVVDLQGRARAAGPD